MKDLDIGEVSEQTGLSAATLRYYETKQLISPSGRKGLRRLYDPSVLQMLSLILLGKKAGFSLDEIRAFVCSGGESDIPAEVLLSKADEIGQRITELTALRDGLRHVAQCSAPSHASCPKFQRITKIALARLGQGASQDMQNKRRTK